VVSAEGAPPPAIYPKVVKTDEWKAVVEGLSVQRGRATHAGRALVTARGAVTLPADIPDGAGIH
jgi:aminoacyl tRNA synthase complex-interacting multifunctional protein 1